jgi:glycosyltransferase involved in cell wall biosynthesis
VSWIPKRELYLTKPLDDASFTVNIKSPEVAPIEPTIYFTNETDATKHDLSAYEAVVWPSQWAEEHIPVNNPRRFIVPHGFDPKEIYPDTKIPKQCFYASSPDRGLDTLLRAWPEIVRAHPDATLLLTYGVSGIDLPNVFCMGEVDEATMNEIYRTSDFWLHPANGGELFCITGIKAQAAGCWPIYFPIMALSETVKFGTKSTPETFAQDVIDALTRGNPVKTIKYPTWQDSAIMLLEAIQTIRQEKHNS